MHYRQRIGGKGGYVSSIPTVHSLMLIVCKNKNWEVARPGRMKLKKQAEEVGCERVCGGKQLEGKVTGERGGAGREA